MLKIVSKAKIEIYLEITFQTNQFLVDLSLFLEKVMKFWNFCRGKVQGTTPRNGVNCSKLYMQSDLFPSYHSLSSFYCKYILSFNHSTSHDNRSASLSKSSLSLSRFSKCNVKNEWQKSNEFVEFKLTHRLAKVSLTQ